LESIPRPRRTARPLCRPARGRKGCAIDLTDVNTRFQPAPTDSELAWQLRGVLLAIAQHWLVNLPDKPQREQAIDHLAAAAAHACDCLG
jgi:hypothetical protein